MQDLTGDSGGAAATPVASPVLSPDQVARVRRILSRSPYYVDDNAALRFTVTSGTVPVTVTMGWRRATPAGETPPARQPVVVANAYVPTSVDVEIGEGLLFNVTAQVTSGTPQVGATYVQVQLIQGRGPTATILGNLLARTVTANQAAAWPGSPLVTSTEGQGAIRTITGTAPPVDTLPSDTVPNGARWQLMSYTINLNAAASGTNSPNILIKTGGGTRLWSAPSEVGTVGTTRQYTWLLGLGYKPAASINECWSALPSDERLLAGQILALEWASSLGTGNLFTAPVYVVQEWLEVN